MMNLKNLLICAVAIAAAPVFAAESGLKPGESITPFHPTHIAGPLADSTKCFPCTYQAYPQVQVWVHGDDMKNVVSIAESLSKAISGHASKKFKAMIVLLVDPAQAEATKAAALEAMQGRKVEGVAVAVLPHNDKAVAAYKINTSKDVRNTVFVYRDWKVAQTMVNLKADEKGLTALNQAIESVVK